MKEQLYEINFAYEIYQEERLNAFETMRTTKMTFASEILPAKTPAAAAKLWGKKMNKRNRKGYIQKISLYVVQDESSEN